MKIAVVKETYPGERRVALVPANVPHLTKLGATVLVEPGAGQASGFADAQYVEKGATLAADRSQVFSADVVLQIRAPGCQSASGVGGSAVAAVRPGDHRYL